MGVSKYSFPENESKMSKYLRSFQNVEAYNQATLDLPCVSLIRSDMSLIYDPLAPPQ